MTNKEANMIFNKKYPRGHIYEKGEVGGMSDYKYGVKFDNNSKVYSYFEPNYTSLLIRLGLIEDDCNVQNGGLSDESILQAKKLLHLI